MPSVEVKKKGQKGKETTNHALKNTSLQYGKKNKLHHKFIRTRYPKDLRAFNCRRNRTNSFLQEAKGEYLNNLLHGDVMKRPYLLWKRTNVLRWNRRTRQKHWLLVTMPCLLEKIWQTVLMTIFLILVSRSYYPRCTEWFTCSAAWQCLSQTYHGARDCSWNSVDKKQRLRRLWQLTNRSRKIRCKHYRPSVRTSHKFNFFRRNSFWTPSGSESSHF